MANVCLILEGTYPYVSGGVSTCVHQLVSLLPETTFSLVYIGASSDEYLSLKYSLPPNVVGLSEIFLFDELEGDEERWLELSSKELQGLSVIHDHLHTSRAQPHLAQFREALSAVFPTRQHRPIFKCLASRGVWNILKREYEWLGEEVPFIDFFYTWRSSHLPIYRILSAQYPVAEVYHAMSTGYAGLAAVQASLQNQSPLLLTEHGIYAHERAIEIAELDWIAAGGERADLSFDPAEILKEWWIEMFQNISRVTYMASSKIVTLYEGNRLRQIRDGADESKTTLIPNGINLRLRGVRREFPSWAGWSSGRVFRLGFVGRVVGIKDVKMLIKAVYSISREYNQISCDIIGPTDEETDYYAQCRELVHSLGMAKIVQFCGKRDVSEVYPYLDCVLLSSISEAQPLVVLEANCAGIPVVATQVGSCKELLEGSHEADRVIGPSGLLAPIGDSEGFAKCVLSLVYDGALWEKLSLNGVERVTTFYEEESLVLRYQAIYHELAIQGRN